METLLPSNSLFHPGFSYTCYILDYHLATEPSPSRKSTVHCRGGAVVMRNENEQGEDRLALVVFARAINKILDITHPRARG